MSKTSAAEAADDVFFSSEAARTQEAMGLGRGAGVEATPQERFLSAAASELSKLDSNSESFLFDSTAVLVRSALRETFGQKLESNPGYPQMQAKIVKTILEEDRYREIIEDFLGDWCKLEAYYAENPLPEEADLEGFDPLNLE